MPRYENLETSTSCYKVFSQIAASDEPQYLYSLNKELDLSKSYLRDILEGFRETPYIKIQKGNKGRKEYVIDYKEIAEYAGNLWENSEVYIEFSKEFLRDYVEFYTEEKKDSTIQRMLVDDLQLALEIYDELYDLPSSWETTLEDMVEERGSMSPHRFLEHAFKE